MGNMRLLNKQDEQGKERDVAGTSLSGVSHNCLCDCSLLKATDKFSMFNVCFKNDCVFSVHLSWHFKLFEVLVALGMSAPHAIPSISGMEEGRLGIVRTM
mgnify:CR=1 FL=1